MSDPSAPPKDLLDGAANRRSGGAHAQTGTSAAANLLGQQPGAGPAHQQGTTAAAGAEATGTGATENTVPPQTTVPARTSANTGPLQITVPGLTTNTGLPQTTIPGSTTDNTARPVMTMEDLATADPNTLVPWDVAPNPINQGSLPLPVANPANRTTAANPVPLPAANPTNRTTAGKQASSSSNPSNATKRSATTETGESSASQKRQRLTHYRGTGAPPDHTIDLTKTLPRSADPVVMQTPFAPPYQSIFLRQNPDLTRALAHVNCSYLTNHDAADPHDIDSRANTAPTLAELKAHARSLLLLIRSMSISSRATLIDNAALKDSSSDGQGPSPLAAEFFSSPDAFEFLNDLASPYRSRDPAENEPLTSLLNQLITRPDPSHKVPASTEACPLATVKLITNGSEPATFRPGVNPLPHSQINRLMKHADELLLQIDAALSTSGGLLAALPLDLPPSDPRRQTYIGQLIHFMRTMVGRMHVLDRDYGQALGLLAGEATIPAELKLNIQHPGQIEAPLIAAQHKFIINTTSDTYTKIWAHLRDSATDKAVRTSGMGLLDVVLTTRYRALRGGKTIFITPIPDEPAASEMVGRPTVVACAQPGFGTRTSEWERKNGAALRVAEGLRVRAEMAEREVETLKKDVEALVPEGVWESGEKENVLMMWAKVQAEKDAIVGERKQMEMFKSRCRLLEKKNSEMGMVVVKEKERLKKRRDGVVEAQREEIRKLLNQGNVAVAGLKKEVTDLKAQLAQARSEGGGSGGELEASKAEARKLQREVEELKARLQAQGGEEVEEEEVDIHGEEGEEGEEKSEEEEDEESDGENE
ncbi:hypothetical protein V496_07540 [Pseudogymnoascus sp. VKM F-4515 (FW-2607)]|nr:hypothetical protein V496_07540 [Pseudogymnoascus sp. VKM F-4515 (FW-2607)]KFY79556.1 hypothetical protein V498_08934 [Pseudogymnoascus sp. VKM F-4517 (FW-2822)]